MISYLKSFIRVIPILILAIPTINGIHVRDHEFDVSNENDLTPPTVEIISPIKGIYVMGNIILTDTKNTICFGGVPIEAKAIDHGGSGIKAVYFNMGSASGYDFEPPYRDTFYRFYLGGLTIQAYAEDNNGLLSQTDEIKVIVFCSGLIRYSDD
jgi:hypothetical protein